MKATSITTEKSKARIARRNDGESANECTGFALSMNIARSRSGCSVRTVSAISLHGTRPEMIALLVTGSRGSLPAAP